MIFLAKKNIKRCRAFLRSAVLPSGTPDALGRILMYHSTGGRPEDHALATRVREEMFAAQLKFIRQAGYRTVTVSGFARLKNSVSDGKTVAITFDDGYKDNLLYAALKLAEADMKATFYVTVSYVNGAAAKKWNSGAPRDFMTWEDVKKISAMGFEIGSHMIGHVDLTKLDDDRLYSELKESKDIISGHTGTSVDTCSYPYGGVDDRVVAMAKKAGYLTACSSFTGWNTAGTDPYILKRTEIDGYDTIDDFRLKISGYFD